VTGESLLFILLSEQHWVCPSFLYFDDVDCDDRSIQMAHFKPESPQKVCDCEAHAVDQKCLKDSLSFCGNDGACKVHVIGSYNQSVNAANDSYNYDFIKRIESNF
jgi:hypothetical protein